MASIVGIHGPLDVPVNSAGFLKPGLDIESTTIADWRQHYAVNALLPGSVDTAMVCSNVTTAADFEKLEAMLIRKYPMDRIGTPEDIANAVLFLASDQAAYVNGALFAVDGGQSV